VEGSDKVGSMSKSEAGKPLVIGRRITKPVDEIVECERMKRELRIDLFVVFISVNKVRRGSGEVRAVGSGFAIGR